MLCSAVWICGRDNFGSKGEECLATLTGLPLYSLVVLYNSLIHIFIYHIPVSEIRRFEIEFQNNRHFVSTLICHGQFVKLEKKI